MDIPDEVMQLLQPGQRIRLRGSLIHIRAIVDEDQIVYREWWPRHRRWEYKVEWVYAFYIAWKEGQLGKG
jgi:hypothetical protein